MGIKCILEPRNTGYEPTIMGTSSNWTGEKGLKDLVMPTCLAPSDVWPMINAHPRPFFLKGMGKSPWFLLANHRLHWMLGAPKVPNPAAKHQGTSVGNHLTCSSTRERPTGRLVQCFGIANV